MTAVFLACFAINSVHAVTPLDNVAKISLNYGDTCAVTTAGGVKCWGSNFDGQFGDNSTTNRLTPIDVPGLFNGVDAIAAGASHTCALTTTGGVKCWGGNTVGQLGDNSTTISFTPIDVSGLTNGVSAIAAGTSHTCAVTTTGGAKCWGGNTDGQLGDNSTINRLTPVDVTGLTSGIASIAPGMYHSCALTTGGGVKCWGSNAYGQLGNNTTSNSLIPVDVTTLTSGVKAITVGALYSCALTTEGGVKCWGSNAFGQLGNNTTTNSLIPLDVTGLTSGIGAVSAAAFHTCALSTTGATKCWGDNKDGELGDSSSIKRLTPVDVTDLGSGIARIASGLFHTCAVTTAGGLKCWGLNDDGQLGNNSNTTGLAPVDVLNSTTSTAYGTIFTTGFETGGWSKGVINYTGTGTSPIWNIVFSAANPTVSRRSGSYMAYFNSYDTLSGYKAILYQTTGFAIPSFYTSAALSYWVYHDIAYPSSNDQVWLQVSTDGTNWTSTGDKISRYDGTTGWKQVVVDMSAYLGQSNVRFGFAGVSGYGNNIYIDDVRVTGTMAIGQTSQTIIFGSAPTVVIGSTGTVSATGGASGNAVTFSSTTAGVCSVTGNTVTGITAGTCTIAANQAGNATNNTALQVTQNIIVGKAGQSIGAISFNPTTLTVGGSATASASATSGLGVTFSSTTTAVCTVSGGTVTGITAGTCAIAANQAGNANYNVAAPVTQNITVGAGSQTINTFAAPATKTYGDSPITLNASASSSLPVSITLVSGPATLSGSSLTITGVGSIIVKATQAGNTNYSAAAEVTQTITVAAKALTITAGNASRAYGAANPATPGFTASALVGSDTISSVTYAYASTASQTANVGSTHNITPSAATFSSGSASNYSITYTNGTLTITGKASQSISFAPPATKIYGDATTSLTASATSGLPVSITLVSGPATLNGSTLTITGVGSIVVMAAQSGDGNYSAAPDLQQTITVAPKALTITASNASRAYGAANPAIPGFTAPALVGSDTISNLTYTYAAAANTTAEVGSSHSITPSAVTFSSGSASNYSITYAAGALTIAGTASQSVTFTPPATKTYGDAAIALSASSSSGLTPSITLVSGPATLNGSALTITGVGSIIVKATQAGNINYSAAADITQTITVAAKALTITASNASRAYGAANPATPGFSASGLFGSDAISGVTYSYAATASSIADVGSSHSITPSAATFSSGSASNYSITYTAGTLTIAGQVSQSITFAAPATKTYGDSPITLNASASSSLPVSITLVSGPATLSGSSLTITGVGSIIVKATQAGNTNYSAAAEVTQTITVAAKALTITAGNASRAYGAANPATPGFTASALVGSDTISSVTYAYASTASQTANVGSTHNITPSAATFSSGSASNYSITYTNGTLTITGKASQSISFAPPATKIYGDATTSLTASATSGLPVSITLVSGPATLNGSTLTITGVGSIVVMAAQSGDGNYSAAPDLQQTITVAPKALTITASNASRAYGAANPAIPGFTAPALVGSDTISNLTYTYAAAANTTAEVGSSHSITPSAVTFSSGSASNYSITYAAGALTIAGTASQSVTFTPPATKTYGDAAIALSASSSSGLTPSITLVSGPATLNGSALTITGVGSIIVKATQAGNINYSAAADITQTITVAAKALTITASNASRAYGAANPATPGFSASGLFGSDAISGVTYSYAATASSIADVGSSHSITPSAATFSSGSASNYSITYTAGTLTIAGQANQTIGTISFNPATLAVGGSTTASVSASSGLGISFTGTTPSFCSVSGTTVTGLTAGTCTVAANQSGDTNYNAASQTKGNIIIQVTLPGTPTNITATPGNGQATVSFIAPAFDGGSAITVYTVTSNPGNITAIGSSSPITITGLTNGTAYTFTVIAANSAGPGLASDASSAVTPVAPASIQQYSLTFQAGTGGSISAITPTSVVSDSTVSFNIVSDNGYQMVTPIGGTCPEGTFSPTPGGTVAGNLYTTGAITTDCSVNVSFNQISATSSTAETTWQSIGPFGGIVISLAIDPTKTQTVFAGTYGGGVFKTINGGASWIVANAGLTNKFIYSLAIDPSNSQTIYAGTVSGIYKSTNGGASWIAASSGLNFVYALAVDPGDSLIVYAGSWMTGVYKSTNGGTSWSPANSGLTSTSIESIVIDPTNSLNLYVGTDYKGVFKSTNGGASWISANIGMMDGISIKSLAIVTSSNQTVYAVTKNDGVFKSTNGGISWVAATSGITTNVESLAIDPTDSQMVYAGTFGGTVFKTINGGTTWSLANSMVISTANANFLNYPLAIDPTNGQTLYAGTIDGVIKTTNGGASWATTNSGMTTSADAFAIDSSDSQTIYAGIFGSGVFKSINGGISWTKTTTGIVPPQSELDFQAA
jgi:alpha-tubulin suppressor-like RCC1 family protein